MRDDEHIAMIEKEVIKFNAELDAEMLLADSLIKERS